MPQIRYRTSDIRDYGRARLPRSAFSSAGIPALVPGRGVLSPKVHGTLQTLGLKLLVRWNDFEAACIGAEAAVCVIPTLDASALRPLLRFRGQRPLLPLLLVTDYTRANAHRLVWVRFDDVVFLDALDSTLRSALESLGRRTCLTATAELLRANACGLDTEVAETIARACTMHSPIRFVYDLAGIMGYDRTTLVRRWNSCTPAGSHPHLFLDWLLVVHALILRSRWQRGWSQIADDLSIKERTLRMAAMRAFNTTLTQLDGYDSEMLRAALWRWLVHSG